MISDRLAFVLRAVLLVGMAAVVLVTAWAGASYVYNAGLKVGVRDGFDAGAVWEHSHTFTGPLNICEQST